MTPATATVKKGTVSEIIYSDCSMVCSCSIPHLIILNLLFYAFPSFIKNYRTSATIATEREDVDDAEGAEDASSASSDDEHEDIVVELQIQGNSN